MKQPIYVYYQLDNFYQNHRRYVVCYPYSANIVATLAIPIAKGFLESFMGKGLRIKLGSSSFEWRKGPKFFVGVCM